MALKLNLKNVTVDSIEEAQKGGFANYNGPTPPPGVYNVTVGKIWAAKTRAGDDQLVALLTFENTGENEVYNGATIFHRFSIPSDPSDQYFAIRVRSLDDFFKATSKGEFTFKDFVDAANNGKIIVDKADKVGEPIKQIGKFKTEKAQDITAKTKVENYQGEDRPIVHYVINNAPKAKAKVENDFEEDDEVDFHDDDDVDSDIDDMLGDIDD